MERNPSSGYFSRLHHWLRWSLEWDVQNAQELLEYVFNARTPRIYAARSSVGELARSILDLKYWPPPLLHPCLQNILSCTIQGCAVRPQYERMLVTLDDDGIVSLDWFEWRSCRTLPKSTPILLIVHCITGHSKLGFVKSLCDAAHQQGWRPVAMNLRGCGGLPLKSCKVYSAAETSDVRAAVSRIQQLYPEAPLLLAGYSLGGMLVTKFLSEIGSKPLLPGGKIVAAAVASSPFDLGAAWKRLAAASIFSLYFWTQYIIVIRWIHYAWKHWQQLSRADGIEWAAIYRSTSMTGIDTHLTCKVFGYDEYKSVEDYYSKVKSFQYIPKIRTPCLFAVAADDPFVRDLPIKQCQNNPSTVLAVTVRGGHCAHLKSLWPFGHSYLDEMIVRFLGAVLEDAQT